MIEETSIQRPARLTQVGLVSVPVSDQDRALAFYLDTLGFEKRVDAHFGAGERWVEVAPPEATTTLALVARGRGEPIGIDTGIRLVTEDADAVHAELRAHGVDVDPAVTGGEGVPPMFAFRDPDGNTLRVVARHRRT